MLSHLTPMIAALSLALTAGSSPWLRLASKAEHRCAESHKHLAHDPAQPTRKLVVRRHQMHEVQVLSFGP